ncbi:golgin subfamily A member 6-like protein 22 [Larimichthys crocea]|uniref:golgin subfamily A member 6-like protein 22 n=1 Tax=Larimichthys crocea TaxID=215358 RepID=UPI000F5E9B6D|nr:golgin subfamily A member 6-like protein 22 [Larimichthys crocea]
MTGFIARGSQPEGSLDRANEVNVFFNRFSGLTGASVQPSLRKEGEARCPEGILLKARWLKNHGGGCEEITFRRPNEDYIKRADIHQLYQNSIVRDLNSKVLNRIHCDIENNWMIENKKIEKERAKHENMKHEQMIRLKNEEAQMREQQEFLNKRLQAQSVAQAQRRQISEKECEKRRQQHQELNAERAMLNERIAREARERSRQAEELAESKKRELRARTEEIFEKRLDREREAQLVLLEEQRTELARLELEEKRRQRKTEQAEKFRQLQIPKQIVSDKLAAFKDEQAINVSLRERQRLERDVALIEAEREKQPAIDAERKAQVLESIAAHRQSVMWETETKKREERQRAVEERKAQIAEHRLFLEHQRLRAQEIKEKNIQLMRDNEMMAAEKRARLEQQRKEEHDAAVRKAEEVQRRDERLQQHVAGELRKATEVLHCGRVLLRPTHKLLPMHLQPRPPTRVPAASPIYGT